LPAKFTFIGSCSRFFRRDRFTLAAGAILAFIIIAALAGPNLWHFSPNEVNLDEALRSPSLVHPFGTDNQGRDVFARTLAGARVSLGIAAAAALLSLLIGTGVGFIGGFAGGPADSVAVSVVDVALAFPSLLLAIAISVIIPPGLTSVFIALSLVGWPTFARLSRSILFSIKQTEYYTAATATGCSTIRLILKHALPNCIPLLIVAASLRLGGFMLGEAALSFLGLGVQPPTASWGGMISHGRIFLHSAPWIAVFPGIVLALTVMAMNLLGDSLRDYLDPRMRL
jgi:peptide/nickel transport system permease protein